MICLSFWHQAVVGKNRQQKLSSGKWALRCRFSPPSGCFSEKLRLRYTFFMSDSFIPSPSISWSSRNRFSGWRAGHSYCSNI